MPNLLCQPTFTGPQREMWNCNKRRQMDITGRRLGKTHRYLYELIDESVRVPGSRSWYVGPNYPIIKPLAEQLTNRLSEYRVLASHNKQDNIWTTTHGGFIQFKSADDPESIRGWDCDLVILDEASLCQMMAFVNCQFAANVRSGRFLIGTNVPEPNHVGYDWTTQLYYEWEKDIGAAVRTFPSWANHAIYPGGRRDPKISELERVLPPDIFARRVGADMRVLTGLVYPEFDMRKHIIDGFKAVKCCASIDPAYKNIASIHFYDFDGRRLTAFDEVYRTQLTDPDIVALVAGYPIRPEFAVYDSEDPGLGRLLEEAGINALPANKGTIYEGIMIVKTWFHQGRIRIVRTCEKLIWELQHYAFHTKTETPIKIHDHACDELRYLVKLLDESERRQLEQEITISEVMPRIQLGEVPTGVWA